MLRSNRALWTPHGWLNLLITFLSATSVTRLTLGYVTYPALFVSGFVGSKTTRPADRSVVLDKTITPLANGCTAPPKAAVAIGDDGGKDRLFALVGTASRTVLPTGRMSRTALPGDRMQGGKKGNGDHAEYVLAEVVHQPTHRVDIPPVEDAMRANVPFALVVGTDERIQIPMEVVPEDC